MDHEKYLQLAIGEARLGMRAGEGGPFGAIVVRNGEILGRGHNRVLAGHDPTAHAEVMAIRDACSRLEHHHLSGAVLYSNFEPCPMCLSAIYWADIREVYYCANRSVAEAAGFMDRELYEQLTLDAEKRDMRALELRVDGMDELLAEWNNMENKTLY